MSVAISDISVVVQGLVHETWTPRCLASIREFLPGATVILSTWEGTDATGLDCDRVVLSEDPGGWELYDHPSSPINNVNRQIVSTRNGLAQARTAYVVKVRTDFYFESASFLRFFDKHPHRDPRRAFLDTRALACSLYSRNPRRRIAGFPPLVLHPSDFFFFGKTADIKNLFDIPLMSDEELRWFQEDPQRRSRLPREPLFCERLNARFLPEQYIWASFLAKHVDFSIEDGLDCGPDLVELTESTIVNNLVLLSPEQLGIGACKEGLMEYASPENCFTHQDWRALYLRSRRAAGQRGRSIFRWWSRPQASSVPQNR